MPIKTFPLETRLVSLPHTCMSIRKIKKPSNSNPKTMSSFNSTPNFDNLVLQTLMGRLQIRPPNLPSTRFLNQSPEDILSDADENDDSKTQLAREESKLEKQIIKTILGGDFETLKPNSGQAVTIGENHVCVGFHYDTGSDYRVWEWHGHIMIFDEVNGYTHEYICGNYFERMQAKSFYEEEEEEEINDEKEEEMGDPGLRELIESGNPGSDRILHRNFYAGSPRF